MTLKPPPVLFKGLAVKKPRDSPDRSFAMSPFGTKLQVKPKTNEGRFWSEPDVGADHCVAVAA
jgi:hypothetical protein